MFLIGYFSKRKAFHIVEQRETMDEVEAYLRNHDYGHFQKLVVFGQVSRPTKHAPDVVESAASVSIPPASEVSASEADSTPATTQVM
jgi:glycine/serine hydroxymethyltransferase